MANELKKIFRLGLRLSIVLSFIAVQLASFSFSAQSSNYYQNHTESTLQTERSDCHKSLGSSRDSAVTHAAGVSHLKAGIVSDVVASQDFDPSNNDHLPHNVSCCSNFCIGTTFNIVSSDFHPIEVSTSSFFSVLQIVFSKDATVLLRPPIA